MNLTADRLKHLLNYDPEDGTFTWKVAPSNFIKSGHVAGSIDSYGYRQIKIDGVTYLAHRLVWFYRYGTWPVSEVDHINCSRDDNRFSNLREANRSQNTQNARKRTASKSGLKGVSWHRGMGQWAARISAQGRRMHLGYFKTQTEAHIAYCAAAERLHGKFARTA